MERLRLVEEKFLILSKTMLSLKDIAVLMDCSLSKAASYRKRFIKDYGLTNEFGVPTILTSEFISNHNIDIDLIRDNYLVYINGGGSNGKTN